MTKANAIRWQRIVGATQDGQYGPNTVKLSDVYLAAHGIQLATKKPTAELIKLCEAKLLLALISNVLE